MRTRFKVQLPVILSTIGAVVGAFVGGIYLPPLLGVTDPFLGDACCFAGVGGGAVIGGLIGRLGSQRD